MAITVTCPNPNCRQMATVEDQHAGMNVQCPKCGGTIAVPGAAAPGAAPAAAPGAPVQFSSANFMGNVERLAGNAQAKMLLWIGLGCLAGLVLFTFLPWITVSFGEVSASALGIRLGMGIIQLLLSLGAIAFVIVAVVLNNAQLFNISLWTAGGWGAAVGLWRLINVIDAGRFSGFGLYLSLLAGLGAAGTLGFIAVQRVMKK